MTDAKLIVISNSPHASALAEQAGLDCIQVSFDGKSLSFADEKIQVPAKHFLLRQNIENPLKIWRAALARLRALAGPDGLILIDYEHGLRELMLLGQKDGDFAYGLFLSSAIERVTVPEYALLGSALCVLTADQNILDGFTKLYVAPFEGHVLGAQTFAECLSRVQEVRATRPVTPSHPTSTSADGPKRALLVSYFGGPCRTVGVQRGNYWAEELAKISEGAWDLHFATSIQWPSTDGKVHHVPDLSIAALLKEPPFENETDEIDTQDETAQDASETLDSLEKESDFLDWAANFIAIEAQDAKRFNTLSFYWRYALEAYFDQLDIQYDAVIISGNPYSVFDFAAYAKRKWYSKVLLDYRDPYANNPRIQYSEEAREYARHKERGFNFQADTCVSVNDVCIDFLEARLDTPAIIIPNGYDERVLSQITPTPMSHERVNFVHAGSFYNITPPDPFISSLDPARHRFHHVGKTVGISDTLIDHASLEFHGVKPYSETLSILGGGDCGIVYMSETGFETPTKFFEYVAFGLDVLICTHAPLHTGALASMVKGYPGTYWCHNTPESIQEFLRSYTPPKKHHAVTDRYTRAHSTKQLIGVMNQLCSDH